MKREISGVGFGVYGFADDYILLLAEDGEPDHVQASKLVPESGRASWSHITSLCEGFGPDNNDRVLTREDGRSVRPVAHRIRIVVECEPLTEAETEALLAAARERERRNREE
jgi:hypothetical protein